MVDCLTAAGLLSFPQRYGHLTEISLITCLVLLSHVKHIEIEPDRVVFQETRLDAKLTEKIVPLWCSVVTVQGP